jgi:hypothetical protein
VEPWGKVGVGQRSHHRFIRSTSGFMGTRALTKIQDDQRRQKGESGDVLNLVLARIKHLEPWPTEGQVKRTEQSHAEARREGDSVGDMDVTTGT